MWLPGDASIQCDVHLFWPEGARHSPLKVSPSLGIRYSREIMTPLILSALIPGEAGSNSFFVVAVIVAFEIGIVPNAFESWETIFTEKVGRVFIFHLYAD